MNTIKALVWSGLYKPNTSKILLLLKSIRPGSTDHWLISKTKMAATISEKDRSRDFKGGWVRYPPAFPSTLAICRRYPSETFFRSSKQPIMVINYNVYCLYFLPIFVDAK